MASIGHEVVGIDVDSAKVEALSNGESPIFEPGLSELLRSGVASGRLTFTTDTAAASGAAVHFVGVGTPQKAGSHAADLTYVDGAFEALVPYLQAGDIVAGKSTVPVRTAARLAPLAEATGATLVWNPEFLREGWAVQDTIDPDRLVLGVGGVSTRGFAARSTSGEEGSATRGASGEEGSATRGASGEEGSATRGASGEEGSATRGASGESEVARGASGDDWVVQTMKDVYHPAVAKGTPFLVTDYATAELVKVAANAFLATKISFINAMAEIAEVTGADVTQLADAIGMDPRIDRRFLGAGIGFGCGCLPKDIRAFTAHAEELGRAESVQFLREMDAINLRRRDRAVDLVVEGLGGSAFDKRVAVLGAAFKPHSDDIRDSPALEVAARLRGLGADVIVTDPQALGNAEQKYPQLGYTASLDDALRGADAVVVVTEWDEYRRHLSPAHAGSLVASRVVIDGRNCLDPAAWRAEGWTYYGMGRP